LVLFLHVFLAFPDGRLTGRASRILVATGYVVALGGQILVMALGAFGSENVFAVVNLPSVGNAVHIGMLVAIAGLALAGLAVLAARGRRRGRPRRRAVTLLVDMFALGLLMIAVLLLWGLFPNPYFVVVQRLTLVVLGLAPVAASPSRTCNAGIRRWRPRRSSRSR
jgi:hypothetical protein